ncbi:MAG: helix-turn-helix transcriptional regulator [Planctomycetota bacterium]
MVAALLSQLLIWIGRWSMTSLVQRQSATRMDAAERIRMVGDMLRREYDRSLSVAELAKRACLSRSRFQEIFRSEFGASPIAFHTRVRMEKAMELGRYTGMSWRQIAAQLGYDDPAYFSRIFKNTMGASPSRLLGQRR